MVNHFADLYNPFSYEPASLIGALLLPNGLVYILKELDLLPDWVKNFYKILGWNPFKWTVNKE